MDSAAESPPIALPVALQPRTGAVPGWILLVVTATTLVAIGLSWDISWHMTIGRDTFWTPAHIAIYLGGAGGGLACGWMAIRITYLAGPAERVGSVRIWGGYAPFGAWISIWGALAMLTSAPFDNWWHNAYGLDVKILSPPHVVLFLGVLALRFGAWLLVLREQNRNPTAGLAAWLFCYVGGLCIAAVSGLFLVESWPNRQHSSQYFLLSSIIFPLLLAMIAHASKLRWGTTIAAATYMLHVAGMLWILPLFPAEPKLGPIYNHVTHMVPPPFPQWVILPALAIDLLKARFAFGQSWRRDLAFAAMIALVFICLFLPAQWFFSRFCLTPAANNWFFAGDRNWGYNTMLTDYRFTFFMNEAGWSARSVASALTAATATAFIGLRFGHWMTKVKR
jgi:hypothetical protein